MLGTIVPRTVCKFRASMNTFKFSLSMLAKGHASLLAFVLALAVTPVWADKSDRSQPMNVEADSLRYDDVRQISVFTGRVQLTKGSIVIRGAQMEVRQDPDGFQFGRVSGTPEQPAFYRQKREAQDEYLEGEAVTIYYDGRADSISFTSKAQLRRFRGGALADEISGGSIVYNNLTDMFSVDGNSGAPGSTSGGRVRVTLTPKAERARE